MKKILIITLVIIGLVIATNFSNATDNFVDWSNGQPSVIEDGTNTATASYDWVNGQPALRLEFEPTPTPTPTPLPDIPHTLHIKEGTIQMKEGTIHIK